MKSRRVESRPIADRSRICVVDRSDMSKTGVIYQFCNCTILLNHKFTREDLWVRDGVIQDPRVLFFDENNKADVKIDCDGSYIVPGFIDLQINGGFAIDFSSHENVVEGISKVAKEVLAHGVTSFCPTLVTSPSELYRKVLPQLEIGNGSKCGAGILGWHLEGPFISSKKKGAHDAHYILSEADGMKTIQETFGSLENVKIITLAPEIPDVLESIPDLVDQGIVVSVGHTASNLLKAEEAVNKGASFITHLFNAMLPFHHRDPGVVGLLTSKKKERKIFYGMITDGIHSHPAALRIAWRANPEGLVLVTDAISAMGLPPGVHSLGEQSVSITGFSAHLSGTDTLAGSVATMPHCIKHFHKSTCCTMEEAVEAASLHPAQVLGIEDRKGTLDYGTDADFVFIDSSFQVTRTYIAGELVYCLH